MKRIIALILCALMVSSVLVMTASAGEDNELYAAVINYDNKDTSTLSTADGQIKYVNQELKVDGDERHFYRTEISGTGNYTVKIDVTSVNFQDHAVESVVLNTNADLSKLSVVPVLKDGTKGSAAALTEYKTASYFKFSEALEITGIEITVLEADMSYYLKQAFFCVNDYSAGFIIDDNILPTYAEPNRPVITTLNRSTAIELSKVEGWEDKHSYTESKWPTIIVDENDRLYVGASGSRKDHADPFGATVMATSEDGGITFDTPRQISNTIMDDRDVGLTYLGNGHMLATYFTNAGSDYLPTGWAYFRICRGYSYPWDADEWTFDGYPIGGKCGNYTDVLQYITDSDPDYVQEAHSYCIRSTDYGKTWSCPSYSLKGTGYSDTVAKTAAGYELTEAGFKAPVSTPHGPIKLQDGSVMWVGNAEAGMDVSSGEISAYVSYDEGETWELRGIIAPYMKYGKGNFAEADTAQTPDGVLTCVVRSMEPFTSRSYDNGATWTTLQYSHSTEQPDKIAFDEISHGVTAMPNGDLILASAYRGAEANAVQHIIIYISQDHGRTWSEGVSLPVTCTGADMGYPATARLSDGSLVTVWYINGNIVSVKWTYTNNPYYKVPNTWGHDSQGWYYFDENGEILCKDWAKDSSGWCYLDADGYLAYNQSIKTKQGYRLVDGSGHWLTKQGWQKAGDNWYYVEKSGYLKTNSWMKDSKGWCFLSTTGVMLKNRTVQDSVGYCLLDSSGYWITKPGWTKSLDNWYYVQKSGYLFVNGWMKDSKGWCFLNNEGLMVTNRTVQDSKGWCLVDASGYWVTSQGWKLVNGDWYYVQKGGYLVTNGWMKDSKGWCYLNSSGLMLKNMAVKDSKGWCILDETGYWMTKPGTYEVKSSLNGGLKAGTYQVDKTGYIVQ